MHVYASLADAMNYARDEGETELWGAASTNNARALAVLESASERVDDWSQRSTRSGFGPRIGTNRYDGWGGQELRLRDDLLSVTSIVIRPNTASATTTNPVADTDYYLLTADGGYEPAPYRTLLLHGRGTITRFGAGARVSEVTGVWGYSNTTRTLTATASAIGSVSTTSVTVSAAAEFSPGMTILIDAEQLYVRSISGTTLTVDRGVNGTTAATHSAASAIARYVYPPKVVDATLRLWMRRWRARDGGADGADGGGSIGVVTPRESEDTILRRTIGHLRLPEAG